MAKLILFILVAIVATTCSAEPARLRNFRQLKVSARQEVADDVPAQTPYPPSGIKPDIPFDLPNEPQPTTQAPQEPEEPQKPENTYLPPDSLLPPVQTYGPPDQFYGPPEASGNGEIPDDNETDGVQAEQQPGEKETKESLGRQGEISVEEVEEIENPQSGRLVFRKVQQIRPAKLRSAKLQALPVARLRSQRLVAQPIYSANGALVAYKVLRI